MKAFFLLALALALTAPLSAQNVRRRRRRPPQQPPPPEQPTSPGGDASSSSVGSDASIAPMTLSDASMYMQPIVHNFVVENGAKGIWTLKEKDKTYHLKLQEVVDDSAIKLGNQLFAISALFRTDKKPYHHLDIDFIVDFSQTPWSVKSYLVHEIDGKEVNSRPMPPPDPEDLLPATTGPAAAASSAE